MNKNFLAASTLGLLIALSATAQTQKIGVINMQDALVNTKDVQKAVADLRAKYSPKDQELQKRQTEMTAKQETLRKGANTMSDAARDSLTREIDNMQRVMQRDVDDVKADMDSDQQRMVNELGSKVMQVVTKYAQDNGLTAVFDVSQQPNNILYASNTVDITQAGRSRR